MSNQIEFLGKGDLFNCRHIDANLDPRLVQVGSPCSTEDRGYWLCTTCDRHCWGPWLEPVTDCPTQIFSPNRPHRLVWMCYRHGAEVGTAEKLHLYQARELAAADEVSS